MYSEEDIASVVDAGILTNETAQAFRAQVLRRVPLTTVQRWLVPAR
ncbi:MAG: hypothetical protein ACLFQT_05450 [Thiohalophilus sp.]